MEVGQTEEGVEKMSAPHDVPIRQSARPLSTPTLEGSHQSPYASNATDAPRPTDVWAGTISRLQVQVQLNTSMLEQNRQKFLELENSVRVVHHEMNGIRESLHAVHHELRARPSSAEPYRHDPRDLDVLTQQVELVTNKVSEIDGLRLQLDLFKNTMKRMEEHGSPAVSGLRPGTSSTHRDGPLREVVPPPLPGSSHLSPHAPLHQPLPPMRTASMSSAGSRPTSLSAHQPIAQHGMSFGSQPTPGYHASPYATEPSTTVHPTSTSAFRPSEPLPPPSSLTGWRSAESMAPPANLPPQPPGSIRTQSVESSAGWATVNAPQTSKRPYEEQRPSPYESPRNGSPKRPKLAPIMPRSNYGEDTSYVPSSVPQSGLSESPFSPRSRAPSNGSQSQSQILPTPFSAHVPGHRFIIATQDADSQASWRPDSERMLQTHHHGRRPGHGPHHHGHGRGRGRGPRGGRGRRGRGGVDLPVSELQELGTPEWEKPGWTGSQVSPNGFYNPMHHRSPDEPTRDGLAGMPGGPTSAVEDREGEFPATPLAAQGPYEPFPASHLEGMAATSGGKKTRSKPIRNAEGVLIRKDGRPDMRSVSSANNLRKVHAKKEAERAEEQGRTPTSVRSLAPANSNPMSEDEHGSGSPGTPDHSDDGGGEHGEHGEQDTQERHHELMSKIFPHGPDYTGQSAGERFFPKNDHVDMSEGERRMEPQRAEEMAGEGAYASREETSQMTDVVMREMADAQGEDHQERVDAPVDTKIEFAAAPQAAGQTDT